MLGDEPRPVTANSIFSLIPLIDCYRMKLPNLVSLAFFITLVGLLSQKSNGQELQFNYKAAPVDNPLKGLVPYWGQAGPFPSSMEYWYFAINDVMKGPDQFDWSPVEEKLEQIRARGSQMVIRFYLEYPNRKSGMPAYLNKQGVKLFKYKNDDGVNLTPDYRNPTLIEAMETFIEEFGKKYDGDPRVGFITMGILGHWGEWHTYPKTNLFAPKENQTRIQDAFAKAFKTTKVLMRYPAGKDSWAHAPNHEHPFGYHDDSFAWATLDTGKRDDDWYFEPAMKAAGPKAISKWKTQPIGGEIRPELWGCVFDQNSCAPKGQEFDKCVERLHVTWLMDSGMFNLADPKPTKERLAKATQQVQKMGYELFVRSATIKRSENKALMTLNIENKGVAPFYYKWPVEIVTIGENGKPVKVVKTNWDLRETVPGEKITWSKEFKVSENARLAIRIENPMKGGKPIRFANENQQETGLLLIE